MEGGPSRVASLEGGHFNLNLSFRKEKKKDRLFLYFFLLINCSAEEEGRGRREKGGGHGWKSLVSLVNWPQPLNRARAKCPQQHKHRFFALLKKSVKFSGNCKLCLVLGVAGVVGPKGGDVMLPLVGGAVHPNTLYHVQSIQGAVPSPQPLTCVKFSNWGLDT